MNYNKIPTCIIYIITLLFSISCVFGGATRINGYRYAMWDRKCRDVYICEWEKEIPTGNTSGFYFQHKMVTWMLDCTKHDGTFVKSKDKSLYKTLDECGKNWYTNAKDLTCRIDAYNGKVLFKHINGRHDVFAIHNGKCLTFYGWCNCNNVTEY